MRLFRQAWLHLPPSHPPICLRPTSLDDVNASPGVGRIVVVIVIYDYDMQSSEFQGGSGQGTARRSGRYATARLMGLGMI